MQKKTTIQTSAIGRPGQGNDDQDDSHRYDPEHPISIVLDGHGQQPLQMLGDRPMSIDSSSFGEPASTNGTPKFVQAKDSNEDK
jgi:hypothetical protein